MRARARPVAMGTAIGPAGQLAIGGSKGGTGAKARRPAASAVLPGRSARAGEEERAAGRAGRLASGAAVTETRTR